MYVDRPPGDGSCLLENLPDHKLFLTSTALASGLAMCRINMCIFAFEEKRQSRPAKNPNPRSSNRGLRTDARPIAWIVGVVCFALNAAACGARQNQVIQPGPSPVEAWTLWEEDDFVIPATAQIDGDQVIACGLDFSGDGTLIVTAIDIRTGTPTWTAEPEHWLPVGVCVMDVRGSIIALVAEDAIIGLRRSDGEILWTATHQVVDKGTVQSLWITRHGVVSATVDHHYTLHGLADGATRATYRIEEPWSVLAHGMRNDETIVLAVPSNPNRRQLASFVIDGRSDGPRWVADTPIQLTTRQLGVTDQHIVSGVLGATTALVLRLRDGSASEITFESSDVPSWVGQLRVEAKFVRGRVLSMTRVVRHASTDPSEILWTTILPTQPAVSFVLDPDDYHFGHLISPTELITVVGDSWLIVATSRGFSVLRASDGEHMGDIASQDATTDGNSCVPLDTNGGTVLFHCRTQHYDPFLMALPVNADSRDR